MSSLFIQVAVLGLILPTALALNVAIIGAGIGGASASHFIRGLLPDASITVFEREDVIGGRLRSFNYSNSNVELGGSIAIKANRYFHDLSLKSNLTVASPLTVQGTYAVSNGNYIVFESSTSTIGSFSKMVYRYGLSYMFLAQTVSSLIYDFGRIYDLQDKGISFRSSADLWQALSLFDYTKKSFKQFLLDSSFISVYPFMTLSFIEEFLSSITHINYLQSPDTMHSLVGLIAVAPLYSGKDNIFRIQEGNSELIARLLQNSGANIRLKHGVVSIEKVYNREKEQTQWNVRIAGRGDTFTFDAVVIATPLERANIEFQGEDIHVPPHREYQRVHTTIVTGELQPEYFGKESVPRLAF